MENREDRARAAGLFRYSLVREAADPALSGRQRGELVRELAEQRHLAPSGERVRVSRNTLDRWIRDYRRGGFDALVPVARQAEVRTPADVLALAEALRVEEPARTGAHIARLIAEAKGWSPSARTIQRHLARAGLPWRGGQAPRAFGRFEAEKRNDLWTGDALHGPVVCGHKTYLFAFIDDHSRCLMGFRWGFAEDTLRLEQALRRGMASRGLPRRVYLDNGSAMISRQLLRACACLGVVIVHSQPGKPLLTGQRPILCSSRAVDSVDTGDIVRERRFALWKHGFRVDRAVTTRYRCTAWATTRIPRGVPSSAMAVGCSTAPRSTRR